MATDRSFDDPSAELVTAAIAGDRQAVTELVQLFLPRVYALCFRLGRQQAIAEDATQETFVNALRALPRLRRPESFRSWILMIAANATRDILRRRRREVSLIDENLVPASQIPNGLDDSDRKRHALQAAISRLDDPERELFLLHSVEGVALQQLASRYKSSTSAVKARLHRIRARVRVAAHFVLKQEEGLA